jgi:hypothetical protein
MVVLMSCACYNFTGTGTLKLIVTTLSCVYIQDLEAAMVQEGTTLEMACEVAFKVKKLQAFEFSYRAHVAQRDAQN